MPDGSAESVPSSGQAELRPHAMLLTGPTAAAIAVVRLNGRPQFSNSPSPCTQEEGRGEGFSCSTIAASYLGGGPAIAPFLAAHFSRPVVAGKAVHGILRDGDRTIDDAIVVLHEGGNAIDLNVHGGPWVVRQVLDLASRSGFAIVEASQSLDAAEGATAIEREAMAAMPLASTWLGVRMLASQGRAWRRTRHRLSIQRALRDPTLRHLLYPPRLAILGSPNVGKSTLANQLFAQERSITADLPGTTRDWVGDIAVLRRLSVMLIDTPGLRVSDDPLEQRGIENSREQIGGADLRLLVMEAASPDEAMRAQFPDALVVLNKADLGPHAAVPGAIYTVATRGEGIVALRQAIERRLLRPWRHATALGVWRSHQEADLRRRLADSHSTIHLATPG